jgi:hypothetical protein
MHIDQRVKSKSWDIKGKDYLSFACGLVGTACVGTVFLQPGNRMNGLRLLSGLGCFTASCVVERMRSEDLESLSRAIGYQNQILSAKIQRETVLQATADDLVREQEIYARVHESQHGEMFDRTGIAPPPKMAVPEPQPVQVEEPVSRFNTATVDRDPCEGGYNPEADDNANVAVDSGTSMIFAQQVEAWFSEKEGMIDSEFIQEWRNNPGIAIKVEGGYAKIIRGGDHDV